MLALIALPLPLPPGLEPWLAAQLPDSERSRIARRRQVSDQHLSLLAHGALRHLLAPLLGCAPAAVPIRTLPQGKPVLDMAQPDLHFSLSHSGERVLLGIADRPLGVDIEALRLPVEPALTRSCSVPAEQDWLRSDADFYALWCAKEAALKLAGTGFSIGPQELSLAGHPDRQCTVQSQHPQLDGLHVQSRIPEPGYTAALCLESVLPNWKIDRWDARLLPDSRLNPHTET